MRPIPSLNDLYNNLEADLKSKLSLTDIQLKMVADGLSAVLAAQLKLCYLYLTDIQDNIFPDTADTAENGGELNRIGQIYLNRQPRPATDGIYTASVTGVAGAQIDAGLTFKSNDNSNSPGNLYITDNAYILTGSDDVVTLRSLNPGKQFLLNPGDGLTVTQPVIGLDQLVLISAMTQQPTEEEDTDLYRRNTLDAIRLEPQGGAKTDYRIWSADAAGVLRVFPYVKNGDAGTVQIFVEATKIDSIDSHGTPTTAILNEVKDVIEMDPDETIPLNNRGRRPVQAIPEVLSVTIKPVDIEINGLQTDNASVRSGIQTSLDTYLFGVRPFIAGADLTRDKNDILTAVKVQSIISDTIGTANSFLEFSMSVDGVELNSFTFSGSDIPYLRNVIYS